MQLCLSHKSGLPVAKAMISRWLKEVLRLSGIDTSVFGGHSTRGASTSCLARRGASMVQILSAGDWTNLGTFQRFYDRTMANTPAGRLILEEANVSFFEIFFKFALTLLLMFLLSPGEEVFCWGWVDCEGRG